LNFGRGFEVCVSQLVLLLVSYYVACWRRRQTLFSYKMSLNGGLDSHTR
jgi:hypothetical protein